MKSEIQPALIQQPVSNYSVPRSDFRGLWRVMADGIILI